MPELIVSILAAILSWWRGRKQREDEDAHALKESQEDARVFTAPDRAKPDTVAAFRMHRDEVER